MVPIPTPASAAISRIGASTPDVTKTVAAAARRVRSLRCASARLLRADAGAGWLVVGTVRPFRTTLTIRNSVPYCFGTMIRLEDNSIGPFLSGSPAVGERD